ncbi:MAG: hypothetical protein AB8B96_20525 [Lysobacterales bacterium]
MQQFKTRLGLLAIAVLSVALLGACGTEYDYAKSDATKYERPDVDRDPSNDDDGKDEEDAE